MIITWDIRYISKFRILLCMIDIVSIHSTLDYLVEEVRNLKAQSQSSQSSQSSLSTLPQPMQIKSSSRKRVISVSPEPPGGYNPSRISLEKMTDEQFKSFRV